MELIHKDGEVILKSPEVNLKILTSRHLYIQFPEQKMFKTLNYQLPEGYTREQKEIFLTTFRNRLLSKEEQKVEENKEEENDDIEIEVE